MTVFHVALEILVKAEWFTVDPYMRAYSTFMKSGDAMPGGQVARYVIELSKIRLVILIYIFLWQSDKQ